MVQRILLKKNLLKVLTKANIIMNKQKDIMKELSLRLKMNNYFRKHSKNLQYRNHQ